MSSQTPPRRPEPETEYEYEAAPPPPQPRTERFAREGAPPYGYPPQGQPGYPPHPGYYEGQGRHEDDGPGFQERAHRAAEDFARHVRTPETKEFFKTSEFLVWGLTVLMVVIAGAVTSGGFGDDTFIGRNVWLCVTIVSAAYIMSRGIAKAGTRRGDDHRRF